MFSATAGFFRSGHGLLMGVRRPDFRQILQGSRLKVTNFAEISLKSRGGVGQVRQVSSLKSYVASLVRASLHAFLLEAVHLCMLCQKLCRKLADRLQPAEDPALPLDLWELEVAPVAGPPGPAQEKDDDEVPDCFFWSGKLVMG